MSNPSKNSNTHTGDCGDVEQPHRGTRQAADHQDVGQQASSINNLQPLSTAGSSEPAPVQSCSGGSNAGTEAHFMEHQSTVPSSFQVTATHGHTEAPEETQTAHIEEPSQTEAHKAAAPMEAQSEPSTSHSDTDSQEEVEWSSSLPYRPCRDVVERDAGIGSPQRFMDTSSDYVFALPSIVSVDTGTPTIIPPSTCVGMDPPPSTDQQQEAQAEVSRERKDPTMDLSVQISSSYSMVQQKPGPSSYSLQSAFRTSGAIRLLDTSQQQILKPKANKPSTFTTESELSPNMNRNTGPFGNPLLQSGQITASDESTSDVPMDNDMEERTQSGNSQQTIHEIPECQQCGTGQTCTDNRERVTVKRTVCCDDNTDHHTESTVAVTNVTSLTTASHDVYLEERIQAWANSTNQLGRMCQYGEKSCSGSKSNSTVNDRFKFCCHRQTSTEYISVVDDTDIRYIGCRCVNHTVPTLSHPGTYVMLQTGVYKSSGELCGHNDSCSDHPAVLCAVGQVMFCCYSSRGMHMTHNGGHTRCTCTNEIHGSHCVTEVKIVPLSFTACLTECKHGLTSETCAARSNNEERCCAHTMTVNATLKGGHFTSCSCSSNLQQKVCLDDDISHSHNFRRFRAALVLFIMFLCRFFLHA